MSGPVTDILNSWGKGNQLALNELMEFVYDELRQIAVKMMAGQPAGHTLQPTALISEFYLRLRRAKATEGIWENRSAFFSYAAQTIRNILVSHARAKIASKRGGKSVDVSIDLIELPWRQSIEPERLVDLNDALNKLTEKDHRLADLVKLRFFLGCTEVETAEILGITRAMVQREWKIGKRLIAVNIA